MVSQAKKNWEVHSRIIFFLSFIKIQNLHQGCCQYLQVIFVYRIVVSSGFVSPTSKNTDQRFSWKEKQKKNISTINHEATAAASVVAMATGAPMSTTPRPARRTPLLIETCKGRQCNIKILDEIFYFLLGHWELVK